MQLSDTITMFQFIGCKLRKFLKQALQENNYVLKIGIQQSPDINNDEENSNFEVLNE